MAVKILLLAFVFHLAVVLSMEDEDEPTHVVSLPCQRQQTNVYQNISTATDQQSNKLGFQVPISSDIRELGPHIYVQPML